jgi:hypothetical protein
MTIPQDSYLQRDEKIFRNEKFSTTALKREIELAAIHNK